MEDGSSLRAGYCREWDGLLSIFLQLFQSTSQDMQMYTLLACWAKSGDMLRP